MQAETQAQVTFFLTGRRPSTHLDPVDGLGLRPALFSRYRDLTQLRYDYPLVLVDGHADGMFAQSLSALIDGALATCARGADAERIRKNVLQLEQAMRALAAEAPAPSLSALWDRSASQLAPADDPLLQDSLRRAREAIEIDGAVVDCDASLPARLFQHAWAAGQRQKAERFRRELDRLILKLSDILKSDYARSQAGRSAKHLQAGVGTGYGDAFDFGAMSRILSKALPKDAFPESRRKRIVSLIDALNGQQFIPSDAANQAVGVKPYAFLFDSCAEALRAFRQRMPKLIALAKAIAMAELEIEGLYNESKHDALFEQFGANGLDPEELTAFPDYLVCVNAEKLLALEQANLMEILSSGLPIKVMLQSDDILDTAAKGPDKPAAGVRSRQIARMALGLGEAYVLQSSSSNLYRFRQRVLDGLNYHGPALFSVFSGACATATGLPPYLVSAAAMESRAFPAFTYDPSAGPNWASRFRLDANSQLELDWPVQAYDYEDAGHQRVSEDLAFTLIDFVAGDQRYAGNLARVPRAHWNGSMIAVDECLKLERKGLPDKIPSLLMVDVDNVLHKVIVDERLMREARRCRDLWHNLQELGGIHNSHAEILLARERKNWEERMQQEAQAQAAALPVAVPATPTLPASVAATAAPVVEEEPARSPDEAYIETPRCSSCDECTQINSNMFAYDGNKQAYIANINAGTYAQLVEAAESCQVSIIHPGKPRNPGEAGLDELLKRAESFQ